MKIALALLALFTLAPTPLLAQYGDLRNSSERERADRDYKSMIAGQMPPLIVQEVNGRKYTYRLEDTGLPLGKLPQDRDRTWTDTRGKTVRGDLVKLEITLEIKTTDGKIVRVTLDKLSPENQKGIKTRIAMLPLPCEAQREIEQGKKIPEAAGDQEKQEHKMMGKNKPQPTITEVLRAAIDQSGLTLYRIGKAAGIDTASLRRFARGEMSVRLDKADKLAVYLGLRLTPDPDAVPPTPTPENLARPTLAKRKAKRKAKR